MKSNPLLRVIIFSVGTLVCLGLLVSNILFSSLSLRPNSHRVDISATEMPENLEQIYMTTEIQNIEIDWVCGSIIFETGTGLNEIIVTELRGVENSEPMVYKQNGQTLKIQYSKDLNFKSFGFNAIGEKSLIITVPEEWAGRTVSIETASADVTMAGIRLDEFEFDGASGNCSMTNCYIQEIDMDSASGDISFTGSLDVLDCDAASANCTIEVWNIPKVIDFDAASGDLDLILPEDAGFTCNTNTVSGIFKTDFDCSTTGSNTHHHGDGSCKINVDAMSGDVTIYKGTGHHPDSNHH